MLKAFIFCSGKTDTAEELIEDLIDTNSSAKAGLQAAKGVTLAGNTRPVSM